MSGKKDGFRSSGSTSKCSKVLLAVSFGILLGLLLAFLYPHGVLHPSSSSVEINHWQVATCGSPERVKLLKSELQSMSETNAKLRRQIKELTMKVQQVEQGRDNAQQAALMNAKVKAGPFGTVKSTRTNPTVIPDESVNPTLAQLLKKVAVNNELIVALANSNIKDMLEVWADSIKHVGISNYLVVALDDQMAEYCKSKNIPVYRRDPLDEKSKKVGKEGGNHAVSALKFQMLREFLQLGYSVLLSDIDIVYVQNPFKFLHRDCDVESMSDGHTNQTAYGYNDVFDDPPMGWARYAHTMRIWVYNSGFFYIRPTVPSIELLDRVADRLSKENAWDQAVFNEVLFFPSHPGYVGLHASRRTMDYYLFLNSKVLFTRLRNDPEMAKFKPVVVHINYHPNKLPRMKAVVEYYVEGNKNALKRFPDGSEWI